MEFGILGPLQVRVDGREVAIGSPKLRALLILLLLEVGRAVPAERLIDELWGGEPPPGALVSLRSYISNLRKLLAEPGRDRPAIATKGRGYLLEVGPEDLDATVFERLHRRARELRDAGDLDGALATWQAALDLWRGDALADVLYEDFAQAQRVRLEELRLTVEDERVDALLAAGRHADAIPGLEATVAAHPLRERPHAQLMLALYRAGRAPHALAVFRTFRERLVEELGLDPSPALEALSDAILKRAPQLDLPAAAAASAPIRDQPIAGAGEPALVGRDRELEAIGAALARLQAGHGGLLLIGGEAGIGKTALLEELTRQARALGVAVHAGRCEEADGAPPFWPWVQVLRSVAGSRDDEAIRAAAAGAAQPVSQLVDEVAAALGGRVLAEGVDAEAARFALYEAVATFLARIAGTDGLVVTIDDLHWADATSLQLLAHLAGRAGSARVLVAGTYRSLPADRPPVLDTTLAAVARHRDARSLDLHGLDLDAVRRLLEEASGAANAGDLAERVHARTGGNPFFVRQLGRLIAEAPDAERAAGDVLTVPAGVRHVIIARLRHLPPEVRATLDAAAVIGREFDVRVLARATGAAVEVVLDHLDAAAAHGLVREAREHASSYGFVHALVNETLYDELPPGRLARFHAAVAAALESAPGTPAADLAEHFWRAADLVDDDRPVAYMRRAADEALAVLAYEQGAALLRRALHLLAHRPGADPRAELEVRLRLIQLLTSVFGWTADEIADVAGPVRTAVDRHALGPDLTPLWWSLWTFYTTRGDMEASSELAGTLLAAAATHDDAAARVAGHVASAYAALHHDGAVAAAREHTRLAREAEGAAAPERLAAVPEHLSVALRVTEALAAAADGEAERAVELADEAIAVARREGPAFREVYARMFAGWVGALLDDPERTRAWTEPGLEASRSLGFRYVADLTCPANAWARARLGEEPETSAAEIAGALDSLRAVDHRHARAQWLLLLADVLLEAGRPGDAAARLEEAEQVLAVTGERFYDGQLERLQQRLAPAAC